MPSENLFKRALQHGPVPVGTWLMSGAPSTAEALGHCGFDFLVLDMEHVPIGVPEAAHLLRAIAGTPAQALVRLEWNDRVLIKKMLDAGAQSLMVPFVQNADEAAQAVAACKYPPLGTRGVAAVHRASRYGRDADYLRSANDEVCVVLQLETREAIGRMREIAAVPGVDALFVGPGDLAADMGEIGNIAAPAVQDALRDAAAAARACGKPVGIVGPNPQMVGQFREWGYGFVAIASDLGLMTARAAEVLAALAGKQAAPAPAAAAY
jgi:2-dehydro-3-deoxyglucarate aldolase/4-hydroxy-2-oxoheptanedioate aldolase